MFVDALTVYATGVPTVPEGALSVIHGSETAAVHVPLPEVRMALPPPPTAKVRVVGVMEIEGSTSIGGFGSGGTANDNETTLTVDVIATPAEDQTSVFKPSFRGCQVKQLLLFVEESNSAPLSVTMQLPSQENGP